MNLFLFGMEYAACDPACWAKSLRRPSRYAPTFRSYTLAFSLKKKKTTFRFPTLQLQVVIACLITLSSFLTLPNLSITKFLIRQQNKHILVTTIIPNFVEVESFHS